MSLTPAAFLSYTHFDDEHHNGKISQIRTRIAGEVHAQTGQPFDIFQDRDDISWGQQWQSRIDDSLDAVTFLIPVVTPSFFESEPCRKEFERFMSRERALERNDLILPIYYIDSETLETKDRRQSDSVATELHRRQYVDWRSYRFSGIEDASVQKLIASMVQQLREALRRSTDEHPTIRSDEEPNHTTGHKKYADDRLNQSIDFGDSLHVIASRFKTKMEKFNSIDGSTNDKFLDSGAHTYTCVATAIDTLMARPSTPPELQSYLKVISLKLKRLANYSPDYLQHNSFLQYWHDGTELADELLDHANHSTRVTS